MGKWIWDIGHGTCDMGHRRVEMRFEIKHKIWSMAPFGHPEDTKMQLK